MASLESKIEKYAPRSYARMKENEEAMDTHGKNAVAKAKEGKYGEAALEGAKGLGKAAKNMLVTGPNAMYHAGMQRAAFGEKEDGMKKGGMVSSASKRADGCATKGKTKGRFV
jgi:hypothetical protein